MRTEKNEMILIYKDENFEKKTLAEIEGTKQALQSMVDVWNALNFGKIEPSELSLLVTNPQKLYKERIDARIATPDGLRRDKYLQLVETPDIAPVLIARDNLLKHQFSMTFELFELDGSTVILNEKPLKELLDSQNLYYPKGSKELLLVGQLIEFIERFNAINVAAGYELLNGRSDNYDKYFIKKQVANYKYELAIDKEKLISFVNSANV